MKTTRTRCVPDRWCAKGGQPGYSLPPRQVVGTWGGALGESLHDGCPPRRSCIHYSSDDTTSIFLADRQQNPFVTAFRFDPGRGDMMSIRRLLHCVGNSALTGSTPACALAQGDIPHLDSGRPVSFEPRQVLQVSFSGNLHPSQVVLERAARGRGRSFLQERADVFLYRERQTKSE